MQGGEGRGDITKLKRTRVQNREKKTNKDTKVDCSWLGWLAASPVCLVSIDAVGRRHGKASRIDKTTFPIAEPKVPDLVWQV